MRIAVTGASGLLGRAIHAQLDSEHEVLALANSRAQAPLVQLDLLDEAAVRTKLTEFKPDVIVHSAAERRPDVVEKEPERSQELNVDVPGRLAALCKEHIPDARLIYISTDYVFDGSRPPYQVDSQPNPLNAYGTSKLLGERAVAQSGTPGKVTSLRVPVLYGPALEPSESAVNILVTTIVPPADDGSAPKKKMDAYAVRYPTNVQDVAVVIAQICDIAVTQNKDLPPIMHYQATEAMTKYDMCNVMARLQNRHVPPLQEASVSHLDPEYEVDPAAATARPRHCKLDTSVLRDFGVDVAHVPFEDWWSGEMQRRARREEERLRREEEERAAREEEERAVREEEERAVREEEERRRLEAEEAERRRIEEEAEKEAQRRAAEEEAERVRIQEEEAARRKAEEEEEAARRRQAEEEEEAARRRQAEEEEEEEEEAARRKAEEGEEAARRKAEEEEEAARRKAEEEEEEAALVEAAGIAAASEAPEAATKSSEEEKQEAGDIDGQASTTDAEQSAPETRAAPTHTQPPHPQHPHSASENSSAGSSRDTGYVSSGGGGSQSHSKPTSPQPPMLTPSSPNPSFSSLRARPTPPGTSGARSPSSSQPPSLRNAEGIVPPLDDAGAPVPPVVPSKQEGGREPTAEDAGTHSESLADTPHSSRTIRPNPFRTPSTADAADVAAAAEVGHGAAAAGTPSRLATDASAAAAEADTDEDVYGQPSPRPGPEQSDALPDVDAQGSQRSSQDVRGDGGSGASGRAMTSTSTSADAKPATPTFVIKVGDPYKVGDSVTGHIVYTVRTRTDAPGFRAIQFSSLRRYSDFRWLHAALVHNNPGIIIPPVPEKVRGLISRFSPDLVEARRHGLETCANKIANHPILSKDDDLRLFLESEDFARDVRLRDAQKGPVPTPEAKTWMGWSGTVGVSSGQKFHEFDDWFDQQKAYLDSLEAQLKQMVKGINALAQSRKDLADAIAVHCHATSMLSGSSLSRSLSACFAGLSDLQRRAQELQEAQSDSDVRHFGSVLYEYERIVGSVRKAFSTRIDTWHLVQRADDDLRRTRAKHDKLKRDVASSSAGAGSHYYDDSLKDLAEAENRALERRALFDLVAKRCKEEMKRFDRERVSDLRAAVDKWLEGQIARREELLEEWLDYAQKCLSLDLDGGRGRAAGGANKADVQSQAPSGGDGTAAAGAVAEEGHGDNGQAKGESAAAPPAATSTAEHAASEAASQAQADTSTAATTEQAADDQRKVEAEIDFDGEAEIDGEGEGDGEVKADADADADADAGVEPTSTESQTDTSASGHAQPEAEAEGEARADAEAEAHPSPQSSTLTSAEEGAGAAAHQDAGANGPRDASAGHAVEARAQRQEDEDKNEDEDGDGATRET